MESDLTASAARANLPFGEWVVQCLLRLGVGHFILSPGSRSTPLTLAASRLGAARVSVVLDERSAAFQALGRIKALRCPVAVICTSGTAGAHMYPAVIEAREAGLPLIVLTADRPPELRSCHAGQTIDQLKLFGTYPLFHAELPLPEPDKHLMRQVREICRRAVEASLGLPHGPVHLNCPFREPFFPEGDSAMEVDPALLQGVCPVRPERGSIDVSSFQEKELLGNLPERTLLLAGPRPWQENSEDLQAILDLGKRTGLPILADGSNPLRYRDSGASPVVIHYDRIARDDAQWEKLAPEAVLLWGEPPTSKLLRQRLAALDLPGYQFGFGKRGMNPIHGRIQWGGSDVQAFCSEIKSVFNEYGDLWRTTDGDCESALVEALSKPHPLFEGDVHRALAESLPTGASVFFASSLAIRDADWFMPASTKALVPHSQRGANGIDGTLSLARGVAAASGRPAFLVTGDLAFLHDSNGMLGAASDDAGVFVILLNNSGGGIFEFLPIAGETENFEKLFATPQAVDFKRLVEAHGGTCLKVDSVEWLGEAVSGWNGKGLFVAEIGIDRKLSCDLHQNYLNL
jgi:2-succinyl-5-enolpyruvyl-6-hydroxy-3-cyclohexene-1-carboxylate synthase